MTESMAAETNVLTLPKISVYASETSAFGISLQNKEMVTNGQIRFTYNSLLGFEVTDVHLTSRTTGYEAPVLQVDASDPRKVEVLILLYSLHSAAILPGDGDILACDYQTADHVVGSTSLTFFETVLVNMELQPIPITWQHGMISMNGSPLLDIPCLEKNTFTITIIAIPEPTICVLVGIGLCGLLAILRKTREM